MNIHWLLRAKRWVQHPPSPKRVRLILLVLFFCLALAFYEHYFGWPDALKVNNPGRGTVLRF